MAQTLEELVKELYDAVKSKNKNDALSIANILEKRAEKENKLQAAKDQLIESLVGKKIEYKVTSSLSTIVNSIYYLKEIGVEDIGKVVGKSPQVLGYSIEYMKRQVNYLKSIGVEDVGKVIEKFPEVLGYSIEYMKEFSAWMLYRKQSKTKI
ncbi:MAG: hypothetical protein QW244_00280 [Candidatus Pacearchaeota archaeon]